MALGGAVCPSAAGSHTAWPQLERNLWRERSLVTCFVECWRSRCPLDQERCTNLGWRFPTGAIASVDDLNIALTIHTQTRWHATGTHLPMLLRRRRQRPYTPPIPR